VDILESLADMEGEERDMTGSFDLLAPPILKLPLQVI
jgi:hypothetical protein